MIELYLSFGRGFPYELLCLTSTDLFAMRSSSCNLGSRWLGLVSFRCGAFIMNSSFIPSTSLQFAWDSTSLGALKTCPRYYQYSIIEGWEPRNTSFHLTFGIHYHKALEIYDHKIFSGLDHEDALDESVKYCLEATWVNGKPWFSGDNGKNRFTLVRSVVWYLDHFQNDTHKTYRLSNGKPAVELSFRFETSYSTKSGQPYLLCGHLDRVVTINDDLFISDRKTTSGTLSERFFAGFSPSNQMTLYTLGARVAFGLKVDGIIIDGAQIAVDYTSFMRQPISRSDSQIDEWYKELGYWLHEAETFAKYDHWPQNEMSCGNYGGCRFRGICSLSPSSRTKWLEADYTKRVWDPLKTRGDI